MAAEELHLTQSAISRQIKDLESAICVKLFRRVGRRVQLTDAGKTFAEMLTFDLERVRQTVFRTIAAGNDGAALRIATLPTFANRWLIPRLPDFEHQYPNIQISLATRLEPFDLSQERFDLAFHFGAKDWPDTKMTKLCDETMIPVASPAFAKMYDGKNPLSLIEAPIIHLETRLSVWSDWFNLVGFSDGRVLPGKQYDQFSMIIAGAISSLGAALLPDYLIERELKDGALIPLSDQHLKTKNAYYIVRPFGAGNEHARKFTDWLINQMD